MLPSMAAPWIRHGPGVVQQKNAGDENRRDSHEEQTAADCQRLSGTKYRIKALTRWLL